MSRPIKSEQRPYLYERKGVWRSNVRGPRSMTTYVGSYPTKEAAIAAANHFIATGSKPAPGMFGGATRRGPKNGPRPATLLKRQNLPAKAPSLEKPRQPRQRHHSEALAQKPQANRLSHEDRVALWRAAYQKVNSI